MTDRASWLTTAAESLAREMPGVVEYAKRVVLPDGELAGTCYDPSVHPGQLCALQAIDAGASWVAIAKPVQDGGSLAAFVPILRRVTLEAQTAMIAYPTRGKAEDAWRNKIWPILVSQGGHSPKAGSGSRGGVGSTTKLPSGGKVMLRAAGGRHEAGQAADTADVLLCDELDDWENLRRIRLIERRVSRSQSPLMIYVSTVKRDGIDGDDSSRILSLWRGGTATRIEYPCINCACMFVFEWEQVNAETSTITCPHCSIAIDDAQRLQMVLNWRRKDGNPTSEKFSILWSALDSPFSISVNGKKMPLIAGLCVEYSEALKYTLRGDFGFMRQFYRDRLTRPFMEPEADGEISNKSLALASERSTYEKRMVPEWATFLTMAQDVQGDRHYWLTVAHGPGERWAIVDWGYELLVPMDAAGKSVRAVTPADRLDTLTLIRNKADEGWQVEGGERRMRPVMRGIDIGWLTDEIAAWVQGEPSWKAVRGVGEDEAKHVTGGHEKRLPEQITRTKSIVVRRPPGWRIYWHKVDGHHFRRAAHAALLRDADAQASGQLPRGLKSNDALLLHLSAEIWKDDKPGKPGYWFEARKRHDFLDCLIYALALALLHRYAPERRDDGDEEPESPPPPPPQTSGWIDSSSDYSGSSWLNG